MVNLIGRVNEPQLLGDAVERLAASLNFVEYVVEWEDGRELWEEDFITLAKAIRYRRRMAGFLPFRVTAWQANAQGGYEILWDMEWTAADMRPGPEDERALRSQRVPDKFLRRLFPHK
jgi:hypothetical protein